MAYGRRVYSKGLKLAFAVSFGVHLVLFGVAAYATRPERPDVRLEYIETRLVRWAPKAPPKNQLPHKDIMPAPPKPKNIAVNPDTAKKKVPKKAAKKKVETNKKKDYSKDIKRILAKFNKRQKFGKTKYTPDGSPDGVAEGTLSPKAKQILMNAYLAQISLIFKQNWEIPAIIDKEDLVRLQCTIEFRLDPSGKIVKAWVKTSSGDSRFDASALAAVRKSARVPLPAHPKLREMVLKYGMFYTFIPEEALK